MTKNPFKVGDILDDPLNSFDAVLSFMINDWDEKDPLPTVEWRGRTTDAELILESLVQKHCPDVMPRTFCLVLQTPIGSTYAKGAKLILRVLQGVASRQVMATWSKSRIERARRRKR